jgi:hypothetical protein
MIDFARLARELAEAREQQAATSELLKVIGLRPTPLKPGLGPVVGHRA